MDAQAYELTVAQAQAGRTVYSLLRRELRMADGFISHLKALPDGVCLNREPVRVHARVRAGDALRVRLDDRGANPAPAADCGVRLVWEDEFLAVLDKPAGVAVHGVPGGPPTVAGNAALFWGPDLPFHPVSRLDRGTSGLMLAAKCGYLHDRMRNQLHTDGFSRRYLAVASRAPVPAKGSVTLPIGRDEADPLRRVADPGGRPSRTDYETLWTNGGPALLRVAPFTGRTHQIRVHLAALGCPLTGDIFYGGPETPGLARPALHSAYLRFVHPLTGQTLRFSSPLPADLRELLARAGCDPEILQETFLWTS